MATLHNWIQKAQPPDSAKKRYIQNLVAYKQKKKSTKATATKKQTNKQKYY